VIYLLLLLVWLAVLTPFAFSRFKDQDAEKAILSFSEGMARLRSRSGTAMIEPAHRLDVADESAPREVFEYEYAPPTLQPHLRVVAPNATMATVDADLSWDQWSRIYSDDPEEVVNARHSTAAPSERHAMHTRAAAYARPHAPATMSAQNDVALRTPVAPARTGVSQSALRRRSFLIKIVAATAITTLGAVASGWSFFTYLAVLSWIALVGFVGAMYYYANAGTRVGSSQALRPQRAATPSRGRSLRVAAASYESEEVPYASEFYDPSDAGWSRSIRTA
jgi:hypothetical protein